MVEGLVSGEGVGKVSGLDGAIVGLVVDAIGGADDDAEVASRAAECPEEARVLSSGGGNALTGGSEYDVG